MVSFIYRYVRYLIDFFVDLHFSLSLAALLLEFCRNSGAIAVFWCFWAIEIWSRLHYLACRVIILQPACAGSRRLSPRHFKTGATTRQSHSIRLPESLSESESPIRRKLPTYRFTYRYVRHLRMSAMKSVLSKNTNRFPIISLCATFFPRFINSLLKYIFKKIRKCVYLYVHIHV